MPPASPPRVPAGAGLRGALWQRLFELPAQPALPLQARLRLAIVGAILEGRITPGAALPSSRELAKVLALSRNTVTAAYQQLIDDGFLASRPRHGVFVAEQAAAIRSPESARLLADRALASAAIQRQSESRSLRRRNPAPDWSQRVLRSLAHRPTLAKPERWQQYEYPFVYGIHDPQLFPVEDFRECCVRSLARAQMPQWTPDLETDDVPELVEQIRLRLLPKRGVFALPGEILVTVGAQQAYHLLAEALLDGTRRLGFEEPGYPHARNTFSLRHPQWVPLPVDGEGVVLDAFATEQAPALDYLFVTPSQQSPTTATLSLARRESLLRLAELRDVVVIEDDYEAENLYAGSPMPALKSLDRSGRVIYIGSVSKSLSPALRLGYIVAPPPLIAELRLLRHAMVRHPSAFLQHAYALFLSLGHHESHARRVNEVMQERLQRAALALRGEMPDYAFVMPQGGASIWLRAPQGIDAGELAEAARRHGVLIETGEVFFARPPSPCRYFRLRLSSIATEQIGAGIQALAESAGELARLRGLPLRAGRGGA